MLDHIGIIPTSLVGTFIVVVLAQVTSVTDIVNGWQMVIIILPSILAFLTSCFAVYMGYMNQKLIHLGNVKTDETSDKVDKAAIEHDKLSHHINSRLDELVASVKRASYSEGLAAGKEEREREREKVIN